MTQKFTIVAILLFVLSNLRMDAKISTSVESHHSVYSLSKTDSRLDINNMHFKHLSSSDGLPCDEVQAIYQDRDGFLWIGTRLGLFRYDGYLMKAYKNSRQHPQLLTSNNITCLSDDGRGNLWIGTNHGLNRLDKHSGLIQKYMFKEYANCNVTDCILQTRAGEMWLGTDGGIYTYDRHADRFVYQNSRYKNVPRAAVKSLIEDDKGFLWMGTWDSGVYQYDRRRNRWRRLPKLSRQDNGQCLCMDSRHQLWIGVWGRGVYLVDNPYQQGNLHYTVYDNHGGADNLRCNYINSMMEDKSSQTMWFGTGRGLSVCQNNNDREKRFVNYPGRTNLKEIAMSRGVTSLTRDDKGRLWMCTLGGGAVSVETERKMFSSMQLYDDMAASQTDFVQCMASNGKDELLLGLAAHGILSLNMKTMRVMPWLKIPELTGRALPGDVLAIKTSRNRDLLIGTRHQGCYIYAANGTVKHLTTENSADGWLTDNCVYCFNECADGSILMGTWAGLCMMHANGSGIRIQKIGYLNIGSVRIIHILQSSPSEYWLSTDNLGIIRAEGDIRQPLSVRVSVYLCGGSREAAQSLRRLKDLDGYQGAVNGYRFGVVGKAIKDRWGRIWACSSETGLLEYNRQKNVFECLNDRYSIPNENVSSIETDGHGNLWLSTNYGLIRLFVSPYDGKSYRRLYTVADGLPDNYLGCAVSCMLDNGMMVFGNLDNVTLFNTAHLQICRHSTNNAMVTGIKIFNRSLDDYDADVRAGITDVLPPFTSEITLQPNQNDMEIDFSTLDFPHQTSTRFAYMLDGYDKTWKYAEGGDHSAYYSNLPSGTYTFLLKCTDDRGVWSKTANRLTVVVLPPLWLRWWAFLIYLLLIAAAIYLAYRVMMDREKERQQVRMARMEKAKIEELNHNKLRFFTNITQDLLTPLTIISAAVDDLERPATNDDSKENISVIKNNIARLMRLLQQILAFRKAETGNLHLNVMEGSLTDFCRNEVESILPLMKSRHLKLSITCHPEHIRGYFDVDALDKIIYNLLSNAAKYCKANGNVEMNVTYDNGHIVISVRDHGEGMSKEQLKNLFTRFYEGEHRRFNTFGTGIGLSLTRDLVQLHKGEIHVDSTVGMGTPFIVDIPIARNFYSDTEVMEQNVTEIEMENEIALKDRKGTIDSENTTMVNTENNVPDTISEDDDRELPRILIVEDNEELMNLMKRLLNQNYRVISAENGVAALKAIRDNEEVDLIISDIMMPEMDGIELTKRLKSNIETSHIPIILLTAKLADEDRTEAYNVGADAYITKPFNMDVLEARIRNLLVKRQRMAESFQTQLGYDTEGIELTSVDEDFIKRAVDCVKEHLADSDFDQQAFADAVGVSKSTLYKKLKSLTDMNTPEFIRNYRMKTAHHLLEQNPSIRISDLAYSVGYSNPKYFSASFKKEFGLLPSEYAEQLSKSQDSQDSL